MSRQSYQIAQAIEKLELNLSHVARVSEWSVLMGYDHPQKFANQFLRHFAVRPLKVLDCIRLRSIVRQLRSAQKYTNLEIAHAHSLPDEKALNNFTKYHLGFSPSRIRTLPESILEERFKKFGNKIPEQNSRVKSGNRIKEQNPGRKFRTKILEQDFGIELGSRIQEQNPGIELGNKIPEQS